MEKPRLQALTAITEERVFIDKEQEGLLFVFLHACSYESVKMYCVPVPAPVFMPYYVSMYLYVGLLVTWE